MATKKTDNAALATKVALRSWLLRRMGLTEITVLDTCAGAGRVWGAMESVVTIRQWIRCDIKPRQGGTLAMSATQAVQSMPLDAFNVIDIDPYGEPWEPYLAMLARLTRPTAVFLTHGCMNMSGTVSAATLKSIGIPPEWPVPKNKSLPLYAAQRVLESTWRYARIDHSARVAPTPAVTYYALGLTPGAQEKTRG